jgi:5-methyltetrahydropteroyltriglutamate--homocysteine methyltransferase
MRSPLVCGARSRNLAGYEEIRVKRSSERILTTHTGSLARPPELLDELQAGSTARDPAFSDLLRASVRQIVREQAENGVDVVSDGEFGKPQFADYVADRLNGMEGQSGQAGFVNPSRRPEPFPAYAAWLAGQPTGVGVAAQRRPVCVGPLSWKDRTYQSDIDNFKAALNGIDVEEAFLPAPSPGIIAMRIPNEHYPSEEAYLYGLAECLKDEYEAIANAGLILQIDAPDVAMAWDRQEWNDLSDFRKAVAMRIDALNHALRGIPEQQIRFHVCWGNGERPHTGDIALREIVDLVLKAKAAAYSIEASNPRHAHEWQLWQEVKLPPGKILIPGVIDSLTNFVEHPDLVALRLTQYAGLVGRENVIAGTDCGFSTAATASPRVHPEIVMAKFRAMAEGADIASRQLWK